MISRLSGNGDILLMNLSRKVNTFKEKSWANSEQKQLQIFMNKRRWQKARRESPWNINISKSLWIHFQIFILLSHRVINLFYIHGMLYPVTLLAVNFSWILLARRVFVNWIFYLMKFSRLWVFFAFLQGWYSEL